MGLSNSRKEESTLITYHSIENVDNDDIYTKDGTIDYCNNPANKLTTGTWKACPYILGVFLPKFILLHTNVLMVGRNVLYSICLYRN